MGLGVAQICVTGAPVTMLAKEKKTHYKTQKRFFLSIAGCAVAQKFVSIDLDIAHCFDFTCRFFAGDFFVRMSWGKFS
jgi:hypothetical protein